MASESPSTERRAALRALLVERAAEQSGAAGRTAGRPHGVEPGRLRTLLVTGVVAVAVVAGSLVALQLTHAAAPTAAPAATATPSASPTEVEPTATPSPTRPLIAPTGWQERTREELHAFVAGSSMLQQDPANAAIWEEQAWLDIRCMADAGYVFDPVAEQLSGDGAGGNGLTAEQQAEFQVLMYGPETSAPYDWRTAGCHGRSVHETGQDHAN